MRRQASGAWGEGSRAGASVECRSLEAASWAWRGGSSPKRAEKAAGSLGVLGVLGLGGGSSQRMQRGGGGSAVRRWGRACRCRG